MKYFSFKILIFCILLPPVLHLITVQWLEGYITEKQSVEIEQIYLGETRSLFDGGVRLKDAVNNNIDQYLQQQKLAQWGLKTDVLVTTRKDTIIYPAAFEEEEDSLIPPSRQEVASENFKIMNEGLQVQVKSTLERSSLLVISIFSFYSLFSLSLLYRYYRIGAKKVGQEVLSKEKEISRLLNLEKQNTIRLEALREDKKYLASEFRRIKMNLERDKEQASRNEDEMINEIISLEDTVKNSLALYDEQQKENETLREMLKKYEKENSKERKNREKALAALQKRFNTLYKNLSVHPRACEGMMDLTEEMRLKAEEVIHQLDRDPMKVQVKRKVLVKKNPDAILEVVFAYSGRLYFRNAKGREIEVLAIGNKNTQAKDLLFLNRVE